MFITKKKLKKFVPNPYLHYKFIKPTPKLSLHIFPSYHNLIYNPPPPPHTHTHKPQGFNPRHSQTPPTWV